jgi:hypothetical protein
LRGVGPRLDEKHRFFIYRKINTKKFPTKFEVLDKLIALTMLYGSSINMQAAQIQYFKAYKDNIPKPFKKLHEHPISYSENAEKEKQEYEKSFKKMVQYLMINYVLARSRSRKNKIELSKLGMQRRICKSR